MRNLEHNVMIISKTVKKLHFFNKIQLYCLQFPNYPL